MQERLPRITKYQNFRPVINMFFLPQNRSLNYEDLYDLSVE